MLSSAMHRSNRERFQEMRADVVRHLRAWFRAEEDAKTARRAIRKSFRRFYTKATQGHATHEHKEANRYTRQGAEHYNSGNYRDAEEVFQRAVALDPGYARAHYYLGNTYYRRGRLTEAVTAWKHAIDAQPQSEVADDAREKLLIVGHGEEGILSTIKDQMLHRR